MQRLVRLAPAADAELYEAYYATNQLAVADLDSDGLQDVVTSSIDKLVVLLDDLVQA